MPLTRTSPCPCISLPLAWLGPGCLQPPPLHAPCYPAVPRPSACLYFLDSQPAGLIHLTSVPAPRLALPWSVAPMSTSQPLPLSSTPFSCTSQTPACTLCSPFPNCILFFLLTEHIEFKMIHLLTLGLGWSVSPQTGSPMRQRSYLWPLHTKPTPGSGPMAGLTWPHRVRCLPFWVLRAGSRTWEQQCLTFQGLAGGRGCLLPAGRHRGHRAWSVQE